MRKIKRFEPLSVMKIAGICYGTLGLFEGAIFSVLIAVTPFAASGGKSMSGWLGLLLGSLAFVCIPIVLGIFGALMAGLGAVIYNVSARYVGGIAVEVE